MGRWIGFLRAVNVGKRRVSMEQLRDDVGSLGLEQVWTFVNSGNVAFTGSGPRADLERRLEQAFQPSFGFVVETFLRSAQELHALVAAEPFGVVPKTQTHMVTFLRAPATRTQRGALESLSGEADTIEVAGRDVHWHINGRVMDSALKTKDWERTGVGPCTSRNTTMLRRLAARLDG